MWGEVIGNLTSVTVITEERQNPPLESLEILGVVANNQGVYYLHIQVIETGSDG